MDTLVLASHDLIVGQATYNEAAEAIIDADEAIYSGAHCGELVDEFTERGFGTLAC